MIFYLLISKLKNVKFMLLVNHLTGRFTGKIENFEVQKLTI